MQSFSRVGLDSCRGLTLLQLLSLTIGRPGTPRSVRPGTDGRARRRSERQMYQSMFLWLSEATRLIARRLINTLPTESLDEASALDMARKDLVRALFDRAVRSEGVCWMPPEAEDPSEPPQLPEPDKWEPIEAGWWSHERYKPYIEQYSDTPEPLRFLFVQGNLADEEVYGSESPYPRVVNGWHLLDQIVVRWEDNSFEPIGSEGDYVYARIRVSRVDVHTYFGGQNNHILKSLRNQIVLPNRRSALTAMYPVRKGQNLTLLELQSSPGLMDAFSTKARSG